MSMVFVIQQLEFKNKKREKGGLTQSKQELSHYKVR